MLFSGAIRFTIQGLNMSLVDMRLVSASVTANLDVSQQLGLGMSSHFWASELPAGDSSLCAVDISYRHGQGRRTSALRWAPVVGL